MTHCSTLRIQSRTSACFAALVGFGLSVFLFEYVVLTRNSCDHSDGGLPASRWRTTTAQPRPHVDVVPPAALAAVHEGRGRRQAVVVPAHAGDLEKALESLAAWPSRCHESTLVNADLVLYFAGGPEDDVAHVLPSLAKTGGKCFAATRLLLANLSEEVGPNWKDSSSRSKTKAPSQM